MRLNAILLPAILATLLSATFASAQTASSPNRKRMVFCEGDAALAKLPLELLSARREAKAGRAAGESMRERLARRAPHAVREGELQFILGAQGISEDLLRACKEAGARVIETCEAEGHAALTLRCADPEALIPLARRKDVRGLALEPRARLNAGAALSQADSSIRAALARSQFGVNGSGVRVGVLSDTFHRVIGGTLSGGLLTNSASQVSGDLPASIRIVDPGPGNGTDEGAAMAELIYDLAPGCNLSFASAFSGYMQFAQNITRLRNDSTAPARILVDDVNYFVEPVYQDGPIALAAADAVAAGIPYYSAAGNYAANAHERAFADLNPAANDLEYPPTGVDFHDFGAASGGASNAYLAIELNPGASLDAILHWDEPYGGVFAAGPGATCDLDLYIVKDKILPLNDQEGGNILAYSAEFQGVPGTPEGDSVEDIGYTNSTAQKQTVYVVVDHFDGRRPVTIHLLLYLGGGAAVLTPGFLGARTVVGHPVAEGVMAVAAMDYREIDTGGNVDAPPGVLNVEPFSSLGGNLPIWFSRDGATRFASPQRRFKPEITAPDGTNTSFFGGGDTEGDGFQNFYGTSAAAPHAAAVAALALSARPGLTPAGINRILRETARDVESAAGRDALSGDGLIDAYLAVQRAKAFGGAAWMIH